MTSYSTVQKQQLSQLGAYLQEKRQEQGKSLEDISLQTYIRAQLLKAVETGDTSDLPQPIFVQGFIRRYADALGLDGANFAKQFPVHSIPDTPRPVARPATPVDTTYRDTSKVSPAQSKPNRPKPTVGALPTQTDPSLASFPDSTGISGHAPSDKTGATREFNLDPRPMSDNELAALGLGNSADSTSQQSSASYQSAPFIKEKPAKDGAATTAASAPSPALGALPAKPMGSSLSDSSNSGVNWLPLGIGVAVLAGAIALIGPRIIGGSDQQPTPTDAEAPQTELAQADPAQTETAPAESPQAETSQTEVLQPPPETPQALVEEPPEPAPTVSDAPVSLQVEITEAGPSWMSVVVDGKVAFEGLLDPGVKQTWEGQKSITMNVGNAGAAIISANGSEPKPAGNPGGAEFLTFTPTDAAAE
ncbi:MAG: RodZ domain-containing protein [Cyanobacteria bacterium P01_F01_bin.13]